MKENKTQQVIPTFNKNPPRVDSVDDYFSLTEKINHKGAILLGPTVSDDDECADI